MLTIRLQRRGRKNDPTFRMLVLDSKSGPKAGNYVELLGSYDARTDRVEIKADRIKHWMSQGAQVSDTVHNILVNQGVIDAKKRNVLPKKTVAKVEAPAEAPAAAAEAPAEAAAPTEASAAPAAETPAPEAAPEAADASASPEEAAA